MCDLRSVANRRCAPESPPFRLQLAVRRAEATCTAAEVTCTAAEATCTAAEVTCLDDEAA